MSQTKRQEGASQATLAPTPHQPTKARFLIGVQLGSIVTTGVNAAKDKAKLSLTQHGLLIEQEKTITLVPYANISQVDLA